MGQETSRQLSSYSSASRYDAQAGLVRSDLSLWEGVPDEVKWLVQAQVKLLISVDPNALLYRPEQLEMEQEHARELQTHEAQLASSALRDRALTPRLQRVIDQLVPHKISEAQFWANFFSHVDVIKVRLVTDFLRAQDLVTQAKKEKWSRWMSEYDNLSSELKADVKHASERICMAQPPLQAKQFELQMGFDASRLQRWRPGGEAYLDYAEDGPYEIAKVIHRRLAKRSKAAARKAQEVAAAAPAVEARVEAEESTQWQAEGRGDGAGDALDATPSPRADPSRGDAYRLTNRSSMQTSAPSTPALSHPLAMPDDADPFVFASLSTPHSAASTPVPMPDAH